MPAMWAALRRLSLGLGLIGAAAAVLLLSDLAHRTARPAARLPRVAIVQHSSQLFIDDGVKGVLAGLAEQGFSGDRISIRRYNAENDLPTANAIAKEVAAADFDLVITITTLSLQAVANANQQTRHPHVFALVSDPAVAGVGISRDNPLRHPAWMAGFATMQPVAATFDLARRLFPDLTRVGVVWNPAEANSEAQVELGRAAAQRLGIVLRETNVDTSANVQEAASALVSKDIQALWIDGDVTVMAAVDAVIGVGRKARIPVFTNLPGAADRGALFDLGADYVEVGRLAGVLAGQVLNGRDPAAVPITNAVPEQLIVNPAAVAGLRNAWSIPDDVRSRARVVGAPAVSTSVPPASRPAAAAAARPAGRVFRIGIATFAEDPVVDACVSGMLEGLSTAGFTEGENLQVDRASAKGELVNIAPMLEGLARQQLDVMVSVTSPVLTTALTTIPATSIVFACLYDPVAAGAGASATDHRPNVTGASSWPPVTETIDLIRALLPAARTIGTPYNAGEASSRRVVAAGREALGAYGMTLEDIAVGNSSEVGQATQALVGRGVDVLWVGGDNTVAAAIEGVVKVARSARLPLVTNDVEAAAEVSLAVLNTGLAANGRVAGALVGKVLRGTSPADIPFARVTRPIMSVNMDIARDLGLVVPPAVLQHADSIVDDGVVQHRAYGAVAVPTAVPGRKVRIGVAYFAPEDGVDGCIQGFVDGLRKLGYVEGENLEVLRANAQADMATIPTLLQNFDAQGLDLIVPMSTPVLTAACGTVKKTPVVFTYVYDPVAAGAGTSLDAHLPNVTGIGSFPPVARTMALVRQVLPGVRKVGTIYNSSEANSRRVVAEARAVLQPQGVTLEEVAVTNTSEVFQAAHALLARGVDVVWAGGDNTVIQAFEAVVKAARDARVPVVTNDIEPQARASLLAVGLGFYDSGAAAADVAARVLGGTSPADIPFANVATAQVSVNLDVARQLGVHVPNEVLEQAHTVVEHGQLRSSTEAAAKPAASPSPAPLGKHWSLAILEYVNVPDSEDAVRGIRDGMRQGGLVEGRDYAIRERNAQGDMATLPALVDAALADGADLIMTLSTPTLQAALQRAGRTPIVFTFCADPIGAGAGTSFDDHRPNVTGVATMGAYEEMMRVVRELLPNANRLGTLYVPSEVNSVANMERLQKVAIANGVELEAVPVNTSTDVADAALTLCGRPIDAVCQVATNLTTVAFSAIRQAAVRARLPVFGFLSGDAEQGAAVVLARDYYDGGKDAAAMAVRIMRGESPAAMPFELLRATRLIVNLTAARAEGLLIPPALVQRAAKVIGK